MELFSVPVEIETRREGKVSTDLYTYLLDYTRSPWWSAVFSAPFKALGWVMSLVRGSDDEEEAEGYSSLDPSALTTEQEQIAKAIRESISVQVDSKNSMITVSVTAQDPLVATDLSKEVIARIEDYVTDYRTEKSRKDLDYYEQLYKEGLAGQLFPSALQERLEHAVNKHYDAQSYKQFGIYPVIWELILQDIHDKLADFVVKDAEHLDGFVPSVFETLIEKIYEPSPRLHMKLKGIVDRIDVNAAAKTFRVLDYKSGRHGGKDLAADIADCGYAVCDESHQRGIASLLRTVFRIKESFLSQCFHK